MVEHTGVMIQLCILKNLVGKVTMRYVNSVCVTCMYVRCTCMYEMCTCMCVLCVCNIHVVCVHVTHTPTQHYDLNTQPYIQHTILPTRPSSNPLTDITE